jgi:hypothetical protein
MINPDIGHALVAQRRAELLASAARRPVTRTGLPRRPHPRRLRPRRPLRPLWLLAGLLPRRQAGRPRTALSRAAALGSVSILPQHSPQPGVYLDGLEGSRLRTYLTAREARQLGRECTGLFARFDDRLEHPGRRPADAVPFEILVLGFPVRQLSGAAPAHAEQGPAD